MFVLLSFHLEAKSLLAPHVSGNSTAKSSLILETMDHSHRFKKKKEEKKGRWSNTLTDQLQYTPKSDWAHSSSVKVNKKFSIIIYFVLSLVITLSVRQNLFSNSTSSIIQIANFLISKQQLLLQTCVYWEKNPKTTTKQPTPNLEQQKIYVDLSSWCFSFSSNTLKLILTHTILECAVHALVYHPEKAWFRGKGLWQSPTAREEMVPHLHNLLAKCRLICV